MTEDEMVEIGARGAFRFYGGTDREWEESDQEPWTSDVAAILAALKEAGLVVEQDWQGMENAPRDGTVFQAWASNWGVPVVVFWQDQQFWIPMGPDARMGLRNPGLSRWRHLPAPPATGDAP